MRVLIQFRNGRAMFAIALLVVISIVITSLLWMQLNAEQWQEAPVQTSIVGGVVSVNIVPSHEDGTYCFNGEDDDSDGLLDCDDPDCESFCNPETAEKYKERLERNQ